MNRHEHLGTGSGLRALKAIRGMLRRPRRGLRALAVVAAAGMMLSACDWTLLRFGPEGTGFNSSDSTISTSNVSALHQRWSEPSGDGTTLSSPVVANGVVYATSTLGRLDAFDAATGNGKWSAQIGPSYGIPGDGLAQGLLSPAVANGVVYAISNDTLYAFKADSGAKLWSASAGTRFSSPVVANGVVYVTSDFGFGLLDAFNATTGAALWSDSVGAPIDAPFGTPVVANGVVYVYSNDTKLHAFSATTGSQLWATPAGTQPDTGSAAVTNGIVYVATDRLRAFNATTGAPVWSAATGGASPSNSPAVASGVAYENGSDGKLYAFNASTGAPLWSASTGASYGASSPAVANGVVYVAGSDNKLDAFNASAGTHLWSSPVGPSAPIIANGVVYTSSSYGWLGAYSLPVSGAGLTMSPTFPLDYGTVLDGTSSPATTFTVTNFGSTSTTALTDSLTGADPSQFRATNDTCAGRVLAGGASCTIQVVFAPTLPGPRTADLAVNAATGGSVSATTLSGTGIAFTIDPTAKDYGTVLDGTSPPPTTFTVTNHSASTVSPTVASLAGSQFTVTSDGCSGKILAAGATCSITVTFTPTGVGGTSALLSVSTLGATTTASLSGTALPFAIVPSTKDYGTIPVGSSSPATFTVTNVSSAPRTPVSPSVTGSGFRITSNGCNGSTLAHGASCTIVVAFAPSATGTHYQGQLVVYGQIICSIFICLPATPNQAQLVGTGG